MTHRIAFGGGAQSVRSIPTRDGRAVVVASADFEILDTRYPAADALQLVASGAATVDPVATTLAADAGRGTADPRALTVASAAGIAAGRRYLVTSGGKSDLVRVLAVDGTTLRLAADLPTRYVSGSTFAGVELSATVPSDAASDEDYLDADALIVRWKPAGLLPYQEQIFVERATPAPPVSADAILDLDPTLASFAGASGMTTAAALAMALEDFKVDMLTAGIDDDQILGGPIAQNAVRYRGAFHLLKHASDESAVRRAEHFAKRYDELRASLVAGRDKPKVKHLDVDNGAQARSARALFRAGGW